MSLVGVVILKFTHAIARVLERIEVWAGRGATFNASLLEAGLLLHCVEAAMTVGSWPPRASHRASAAFTTAAAVSYRFSHGRRKADQKHRKKKVIVRFGYTSYDQRLRKTVHKYRLPQVGIVNSKFN